MPCVRAGLLLPLEFGLSLEQTATIIGLSKSRTGKLRTRFKLIESGAVQIRTKKELRNHARMSLDEEAELLAVSLPTPKIPDGFPIVQLKAELEQSIGKPVSTSTVYQLLRRHGLSKLASTRERISELRKHGKDWTSRVTARRIRSEARAGVSGWKLIGA